MNTDPQIQEEIRRLERLRAAVDMAIDLLDKGLIRKDISAQMPEPFDFRIGAFSIRDELLHLEDPIAFLSIPL